MGMGDEIKLVADDMGNGRKCETCKHYHRGYYDRDTGSQGPDECGHSVLSPDVLPAEELYSTIVPIYFELASMGRCPLWAEAVSKRTVGKSLNRSDLKQKLKDMGAPYSISGSFSLTSLQVNALADLGCSEWPNQVDGPSGIISAQLVVDPLDAIHCHFQWVDQQCFDEMRDAIKRYQERITNA